MPTPTELYPPSPEPSEEQKRIRSERRKEYMRAYRETHKDELKAYRDANREKLNEYQRGRNPLRREYHRAYHQARLAANPNFYKERNKNRTKNASYRLRWLYGITQDQWDALLVEQGESCAICETKTPTHSRGWSTDHDHKTGKVRGILCGHCNCMLGHARDKISTLEAAIRYLNRNT
jgi:hypothetical protein